MKKQFLILFATLSISAVNGISQSYEVIYENCNDEVKSKIDQNKIDGINILSGIHSVQTIGISGLGLAQRSNIDHQLSLIKDIISFKLSEDNTSMSIVSLPTFTKDSLKEILDMFNAVVTGYSVNFVIEE